MSLRVVFRRAARDELVDAAAWYEERREGLGEQFLTEVGEAVEKAAAQPLRHPAVHDDVRCTVCRRFPYAVYFRVRAGSLVVLAVFHGRRDVMNRLHEKGYITDPVRQAKSVAFTEEGLRESRRLLQAPFAAGPPGPQSGA